MVDIFRVGQVVELTDNRAGTIRFIGSTSFSTGDWIGVELDTPVGKNNGTVHGRTYFVCAAAYGMFIRPTSVVRILDESEDSTPKPNPPTAVKNVAGRKEVTKLASSRPSRTQSIDSTASRRQSLNAGSPTPGARRLYSQGDDSFHKLPTSTPTSSNITSRAPSPAFASQSNASQTKLDTRPTYLARHTSSVSQTSTTSGRTRINRAGDGAAKLARSSVSRTSTQPLIPRQRRGSSSATDVNSASQKDEEGLGEVETKSGRSGLNDDQSSSQESSSLSDSSNETFEEVDRQSGKAITEFQFSSGVSGRQIEEKIANDRLQFEDAASGPMPVISAVVMGPPPLRRPAEARKVDELEAKLRVLEKSRSDDREKLSALDRLQKERDRFESVIQKLQAKYQPQQQEMALLRRQLQDSQSKLADIEAVNIEHDTAIEMATLDREMAEETAEALRSELDALKERTDGLEEEVKILREENEEYGKEMSVEERTSQGWLQMERSNERLQEALIRLRDMTQSQEMEMKSQISDLRDDLKQLNGIKEQHDEVKERLRRAEIVIEDLRQQLDAALSAEDIIEELTENNLTLSEEVESLRLNVLDLEDLKELNDELEKGHFETERQLQEELVYKDGLLGDIEKRFVQQDRRINDQDYTIAKFRELVTRQQSHITELQSLKESTEADALELNSQSRVLANLNLKLHGSARTAQIRTVDIELRTLEAQEAKEHLNIVESFLPETYQREKNSVLAYLRFKRVAFKSQLLCGFLQEAIGDNGQEMQIEHVGQLATAVQNLTEIFSICDWIAYDIGGCSPQAFNQYGVNYYELESIERTLIQSIESWKAEQLRLNDITDGLQRSILMLVHIIGLHDENSSQCRASSAVRRISTIAANLWNVALALSSTKNILERSLLSTSNDDDQIVISLNSSVAQLENILTQARGSKYAAERASRSLKELRERNMTVALDAMNVFDQTNDLVLKLSTAALELWEAVLISHESLEDNQGHEISVSAALVKAVESSSSTTTQSTSILTNLASHITTASAKVAQILSVSTNISLAIEFSRNPPPWTVRDASLQLTNPLSPSISEELAHLKASLQARIAELHIRDRTIEEQTLKIEILESRMRGAMAKAARVLELEDLLGEAAQHGEDLAKEVQIRATENQRLRVEHDQFRAKVDDSVKNPASTNTDLRNLVSASEVQALKLEIKDLRGAIRQLRQANSRARYSVLQMSWLAEPLVHKPARAEKEAIDAMEKEGLALFQGLLDLTAKAKTVDLTTMPKDRLAWRPTNEKSRWIVASQQEEWEKWRGRSEAYIDKAARVHAL